MSLQDSLLSKINQQCQIYSLIGKQKSALRRAHFDEIGIVVGSRVVREVLIRTGFVFAGIRAGFVLTKILVPENLVGHVMVLELREVWGQMRDDILVVHYTVDVWDAVVDVPCQMHVANPGPSVVVDLHIDVGKGSFQLKACNRGQCTSQTVSSGHHFCIRMQIEQALHFFVDCGCHCFVICIKSGVDFAAEAENVGNFLEVEVFNPVLDILGPSERYDDGIS